MTRPNPRKSSGKLQKGLSPSAQQRIAERTGYSLLQLHALWVGSRKADICADSELKSLIARHHDVLKLIARFQHGEKRSSSYDKLHAAITKAVIFKRPESTWAKANSKWLSVSSGGVPSLGKRR